MKKILSIVIPCFNMEKYVLKALESIKYQNYPSTFYDVFIIDDESKDNTVSIVNNFIKENNLDNFFVISKKNGNWGSVVNYIKNSNLLNSNYVTILDADDFYNKNLFKEIEKIAPKNFDLFFTGFYEIKAKKIKKGYLTPQRGNRELDKKYMRFPSLIPLCKFFKTSIFLELDNLKEGVSYQDIILWNKFIDKANSFYYIKDNYGFYLNHREGASSTIPFNEKRIKDIMEIIQQLVSDDVYKNGYIMALLMHLKKNTSNENRKFIKLDNWNQIKKFKLLWCPLGTRIITKLGIKLYLFNFLRKGYLD